MKFTPRVLRAVAVAGVATVAPLVAAMPAHAGIGIPQGPDAAVEFPPGPSADAVLTVRKAGGGQDALVAEYPPGPGADVVEWPPGPGADAVLTMRKAGGDPEAFVAEFPPGPGRADIIVVV
jgi:hypothetical protein